MQNHEKRFRGNLNISHLPGITTTLLTPLLLTLALALLALLVLTLTLLRLLLLLLMLLLTFTTRVTTAATKLIKLKAFEPPGMEIKLGKIDTDWRHLKSPPYSDKF